MDNWTVRVNPACAVDQDCDDGDPCTTETCSGGVCAAVDQDCSDGDLCTFDRCTGGVCSHEPNDCEDGDACTIDECDPDSIILGYPACRRSPIDCNDGFTCTLGSCSAGICAHMVSPVEYVTVDAKIDALQGPVHGGVLPCQEPYHPLAKKLRHKLTEKLRKARKLLDRAEDVMRQALLASLLARVDQSLLKTQEILRAAAATGRIPAECAGYADEYVEDIRVCVSGLPQP